MQYTDIHMKIQMEKLGREKNHEKKSMMKDVMCNFWIWKQKTAIVRRITISETKKTTKKKGLGSYYTWKASSCLGKRKLRYQEYKNWYLRKHLSYDLERNEEVMI